MAEFDLVVRGGTIADGAGGGVFEGDVAVRGGRIAAVGRVLGAGAEEIDAKGLLVTPGFVDVHTHFDGQATWDNRLQPSTLHGASTIVMGNCGVGFAPCAPKDREALMSLMEGVEDIPGVVMGEGLPWNWETFPQFMDALDAGQRDADIAVLVPHSPMRVNIMGQRAIDREDASEEDCARMRAILAEGLAAGAMGFSTSRTLAHKTPAGELVPSYKAAHRELKAIAGALEASPGAAFQMISDWDDLDAEFDAFEDIARSNGSLGTFTLLALEHRPELWGQLLERTTAANDSGASVIGQMICRPLGVLVGLNTSMHTFDHRPTFMQLAHLPLPQRVVELRKPEVRAAILSETDDNPHPFFQFMGKRLDRHFILGDPPNYMPDPETSIAALAARVGCDPYAYLYDAFLGDEGRALVFLPIANYTDSDGAAIREMLQHRFTLPALGDGGAHVGMMCDASVSSHLLCEWVRARKAMSIEQAVHLLTEKPAHLFRMHDRGRLAVGLKADINIIDFDRLAMEPPRVRYDLPAGGRRFLQAARGYSVNIVSGEITYRDGEPTNALPGRLVRGPQRIDA